MNVNKKRHELLGILYTKYFSSSHKPTLNAEVDFETILKELKCTNAEYLTISPKLIAEEEIEFDGQDEGLFIMPKGITSFAEKKYLKENRKKFYDSIYDLTKWSLPAIAVALSIYTILINHTSVRDNENSKKHISDLQKQVDSIKQKLHVLSEAKTTQVKNDSSQHK